MPTLQHTVERYEGEGPFDHPAATDPRFKSFMALLIEHGVMTEAGLCIKSVRIMRGVGPEGFLYRAEWEDDPPKTAWFTFGYGHTHSFNGRTLDRNTVVKITAPDPRKRMFELFGAQWAMEYEQEPQMKRYKEVIEIP